MALRVSREPATWFSRSSGAIGFLDNYAGRPLTNTREGVQ